MTHELKIKQYYLIHILEGRKTFEVRINDRDYQVGDRIRFLPLEDDNYNCYAMGVAPLPEFKITYIHFGYGMDDLAGDDFVILGINKIA